MRNYDFQNFSVSVRAIENSRRQILKDTFEVIFFRVFFVLQKLTFQSFVIMDVDIVETHPLVDTHSMNLDSSYYHPKSSTAERKSLTLSQQIQIMDLLFKYFQDSAWKGTLANVTNQSSTFMMDSDKSQGCMN